MPDRDDIALSDWAKVIEAKVDLCHQEYLARVAQRRKNRRRIAAATAGGLGTFIAATAFVVRALLSAGGSAEAARIQTELVRDSAARIRALEIQFAEAVARLSVLLMRPPGP